jgi:hypothetical protein
VFWFSLRHLSEAVFFLRWTERHMIINFIDPHVNFPSFLLDFNENWNFSTDFRKMLKCRMSWKKLNLEPRCYMREDGRTDRHGEANGRFSQFADTIKSILTRMKILTTLNKTRLNKWINLLKTKRKFALYK